MKSPFEELNMCHAEHAVPPERKLQYFIEEGTVLDSDPGPFLQR